MSQPHPTFRSRLRRCFFLCYAIAAIAFGAFVYAEFILRNEVVKDRCAIVFCLAIITIFLHLFYLRFTVSCPTCRIRLRLIDQGYNKRGAKAKCRGCGQVFDLGMSFRGDG
jgi:hypothetical protein